MNLEVGQIHSGSFIPIMISHLYQHDKGVEGVKVIYNSEIWVKYLVFNK